MQRYKSRMETNSTLLYQNKKDNLTYSVFVFIIHSQCNMETLHGFWELMARNCGHQGAELKYNIF